MEDKNQYQALLRGKIAAAIEQARSASTITHKGVKGTVLEILLSKLFRPLLPADIGIGTGQIIDAYGNPASPQIDIVIYNKAILPPILIDENVGIFPIESVLYTIEVKTKLNARELKAAHASAKFVNTSFTYLQDHLNDKSDISYEALSNPRSVIFALNSDLKVNGLSEAERYKKVYLSDPPYLTAICVAGREYSYEDRECWITMRDTQEYDEILNLIAGITNTYRNVSKSRGYPYLGHYIATDRCGYTINPYTDLPNLIVTCNQCGNRKEVIALFDKSDFEIINNTISHSEPCECGGKLISKRANYTIKDGRLRKISDCEPLNFKF
ncbi:DUF6602 domain-containing protein [Enterobacter hormaechei]